MQNLNPDLSPAVGHGKDGEDNTWYSIGLLSTEHLSKSWNTINVLCVQTANAPSDNSSASPATGACTNTSHVLTWTRCNFDPGVGQGFGGTYEGCFRMTQPTAIADFSVCTTSGGRFVFGLGGIIVNRQHQEVVFPFAPMRVTKDSSFFLGSGFFVDLGVQNSRLIQLNVHPEYDTTRLPLAIVRPALCCHPEGIITTQGLGAHWVFHEDHKEMPLRGSGAWNLLQHEAMFTDVCFLQLQDSAFERMTQLTFSRGQTCKVQINKKKFDGIVLRKLQSGKYAVKLDSNFFPANFKVKSGVATLDASDIFPSQLVSKQSFFLDGPAKFGCALDPFSVQKVTAHDISALSPYVHRYAVICVDGYARVSV